MYLMNVGTHQAFSFHIKLNTGINLKKSSLEKYVLCPPYSHSPMTRKTSLFKWYLICQNPYSSFVATREQKNKVTYIGTSC